MPDAELAKRVRRLTAGQRLCLSLVAQHFSSKEIAVKLGISSHTVDQRIRAALRTLNARNRKEAALLLLRHQANRPKRARVPWGTETAPKNDMTLGLRVAWIAIIALGSAFVSGLMLSAAESFIAMLRGSDS